MNELIKELADEAGMEICHCGCDAPKAVSRFVDLILQECHDMIGVLERIAYASNASIPEDYDKHTYIKTLEVVTTVLKTHFGDDE